MKHLVLTALLLLIAGSAVYLITSLRTVGRQAIEKKNIPESMFEIIRWESDAAARAFIMMDPAAGTPVTVSAGLGRKDVEGFRSSREYLNQTQGRSKAYRIISRKNDQPLAFILAAERLEIEAGYNILKRNIIISIRDPEDSHHRRMHQGH